MNAARPAGGRTFRWLPPLLWLALTISLAIAAGSLPWSRAIAELRSVRGGWLLAAVCANLAILPLWAMEWRLLAAGFRVSARVMFSVVAITASVLNSIPFLAGEASAVGLLMARAGLTRGAALSVLAMDQILVAVAKLAVLALAAAIAPVPAWLRAGALTLAGVLAMALALLVPIAHYWRRVQEWLLDAKRHRSPWPRLAHLVSWGEHLDALRSPGRAAMLVALALTKKTAELGGVLAVQLAFGMDPSLALGVSVLAGLALSTLVPVAPANLGVYEATVFGVYVLGGVPQETALGLATVQHLCFLLPSLLTGYVTLSLRQLRYRTTRAS